jgi:hypothetical protein
MWNLIGTAAASILGIVAVAAALASGADFLSNSRANDLSRLSAEMSQKVYQMYSMRPGIFGAAVISDTIIVNNNLAPADFVDDANTALVNGYAGDITVTGAGPRLHVDHDAVPQEACVEVLKNLGQGRGFETVGVASSIGGLSGATVQTLPIADPSSLCTTDPVAIRFTFRY